MIPLNQQYQIKNTLQARPEVAQWKDTIDEWVRGRVGWSPDGKGVRTGRVYEDALLMAAMPAPPSSVLEVGARASFLGAYLTRWSKVHLTDLFGASFRDLGSLDEWADRWRKAAPRPDRLTTRAADMTDLSEFDDARFGMVICKSSIEHLRGDDDTVAMQEMARVLATGGLLYLTTDTAETFRKCRGYYYDETALYERLIDPSGCTMYGPADLSWENADKSPHRDGGFDRSCVAFALLKEVRNED